MTRYGQFQQNKPKSPSCFDLNRNYPIQIYFIFEVAFTFYENPNDWFTVFFSLLMLMSAYIYKFLIEKKKKTFSKQSAF